MGAITLEAAEKWFGEVQVIKFKATASAVQKPAVTPFEG